MITNNKKISYKYMGNFTERMLNSKDETSHKRVISIASFLILTIILVLNIFGIIISQNLIYVFAGLCAGNTSLTVLEKFIDKNK